jgi:transposase
MIYFNSLKDRDKFLAYSDRAESVARMIQSGFFSEEDRRALARDGSSPCRVTRRANALVLLDEGTSCQEVAPVLLYDDDTIRGWRKLFEQRGIEDITSFDVGGSASYLRVQQEDDLKAWVGAALPRSTRQIGAWLDKEFWLVYESRSGLIALLHRLGLEYHKPDIIPRKLNKEKQQAFIERQLPAPFAATAHRCRGTSGRSPRPKASHDGRVYRPGSVLSFKRLRSCGFTSCRRLGRPSVPTEPGATRTRHEPAIGATAIARLVGLRQSLVRYIK